MLALSNNILTELAGCVTEISQQVGAWANSIPGAQVIFWFFPSWWHEVLQVFGSPG